MRAGCRRMMERPQLMIELRQQTTERGGRSGTRGAVRGNGMGPHVAR